MRRSYFYLIIVTFITLLAQGSSAQSSFNGDNNQNPPRAFSLEELDSIVGRIALYPDDLAGLVLAASNYPQQVIEAAGYLQDLKREPFLSPSEDWDPSILGILNYPEVLNMMADDLDWTYALGDAVYYQNNDVMEAIQYFRNQAYAAGNLRSNSRQTILVQGQNIIIRSVDPDAVYVPRYDPRIVIVRQPSPPIIYYSNPYPVYYSPVAPFFTGWFLGYGISCNIGWNNWRINYRRINFPNYRFYHRHQRGRPFYRNFARNPNRNRQFRSGTNRGRNFRQGNRSANFRRQNGDSIRRNNRGTGTRFGRLSPRLRNSTPGIRLRDGNNQRRLQDNIDRQRNRNRPQGFRSRDRDGNRRQQGRINNQRNRNSSPEVRSNDRNNSRRGSGKINRERNQRSSSNRQFRSNSQRGNQQKSFRSRGGNNRSGKIRSNRGGGSSKRSSRGSKSRRRR